MRLVCLLFVLFAMITILRFDYDYDLTTSYRAHLLPITIRRKQKMIMSIFRRSRIVVESQL